MGRPPKIEYRHRKPEAEQTNSEQEMKIPSRTQAPGRELWRKAGIRNRRTNQQALEQRVWPVNGGDSSPTRRSQGTLAAGTKQLVLHCTGWKHKNPRRKENWQRTIRTLQQKNQMRVIKIDGDNRTQTGGDGLIRKNQNRPME
jgi:hypothetical protein